MVWILYLGALGGVLLLALMSLRAAQSLSPSVRLPMQWGLDGKPTWYARRNLALVFTPIVGVVCLIPYPLIGHVADAGWSRLLLLELVTTLMLALAHGGHLYFARRHVEREGGASDSADRPDL